MKFIPTTQYGEGDEKFARGVVTRRGWRHVAENKMTQFLSHSCDNEYWFRQLDSIIQIPLMMSVGLYTSELLAEKFVFLASRRFLFKLL